MTTNLTPLPRWFRCQRHQTLVLEGHACLACVEEGATGVRLPAMRGERLEDTAGRAVRMVEKTND